MISMTGYAYQEKSGENLSVSAEIRSFNNRYLDIYVNLPSWLSMLEKKVKNIVTSVCGRGKIEVHIRVRELSAPVKICVNKNTAEAYYKAINDLAVCLGLEERCSFNALLKMEGVLEIEKNRDEERFWQEIEPVLHEAVNSFCAEREREGRCTEKDILENIGKIESSLKTVSSFASVIENNIKENIKTRFYELLGSNLDENRVLAETASLLLKYTISEEISRLNSHLSEFRTETEKNQRPGKKLDFLCQEINREINTIGSKSAVIEVNTEVVKMKESLENIREQLRNVE